MSDVRELILSRFHSVVAAVAGIQNAERNRIQWDDRQLPAVSVLEGDEEVSESDLPRGRPSARPYLVTATPQVYVRVGGTEVGTDLNTLRLAIIEAILNDSELVAMSLNGRGIRYAGMQSTLAAARSMDGAFVLVFAITYELRP